MPRETGIIVVSRALDLLGAALADHGHQWTPMERRAFESAHHALKTITETRTETRTKTLREALDQQGWFRDRLEEWVVAYRQTSSPRRHVGALPR